MCQGENVWGRKTWSLDGFEAGALDCLLRAHKRLDVRNIPLYVPFPTLGVLQGKQATAASSL